MSVWRSLTVLNSLVVFKMQVELNAARGWSWTRLLELLEQLSGGTLRGAVLEMEDWTTS